MKRLLQTLGLVTALTFTGCAKEQPSNSGLNLESFNTDLGYIHPTDNDHNGIVDGFWYSTSTNEIGDRKRMFVDGSEKGVINHALTMQEGIVEESVVRPERDDGRDIDKRLGISWGIADSIYEGVKLRANREGIYKK